MATGEVKVEVPIEVAIHETLKKCLQNIFDEYGLVVNSLSANWTDISTMDKPNMMISSTEIKTYRKA